MGPETGSRAPAYPTLTNGACAGELARSILCSSTRYSGQERRVREALFPTNEDLVLVRLEMEAEPLFAPLENQYRSLAVTGQLQVQPGPVLQTAWRFSTRGEHLKKSFQARDVLCPLCSTDGPASKPLSPSSFRNHLSFLHKSFARLPGQACPLVSRVLRMKAREGQTGSWQGDALARSRKQSPSFGERNQGFRASQQTRF